MVIYNRRKNRIAGLVSRQHIADGFNSIILHRNYLRQLFSRKYTTFEPRISKIKAKSNGFFQSVELFDDRSSRLALGIQP